MDDDDQFCPTCQHDHAHHNPADQDRCDLGCPCYTCPNCGERHLEVPVSMLDGSLLTVDGATWCPGCTADEMANREFDRRARMAS